MEHFSLLVTSSSRDYELLDSGSGEKLERFGEIFVCRPDLQALWPKRLSEAEWGKARAFFSPEGNSWKIDAGVPKEWRVELEGLCFLIKPSVFKHVGVFPEQQSNWCWIEEVIGRAKREVSILNLFGYTGGATFASARAGASVCHVDSSGPAVRWARENARLSKLDTRPIRWIEEDVRVFVRREGKRGHRYDGIVMDPPVFGRGGKGEAWRIEEDLMPLLEACSALLTEKPLFVLLNGYTARYSALALKNALTAALRLPFGTVEFGELAIREVTNERLLPAGAFSRWTS